MSLLDTALLSIDRMYEEPRRAHRELLMLLDRAERANAELRDAIDRAIAHGESDEGRPSATLVGVLDYLREAVGRPRRPLPKRATRKRARKATR